MPNGNDPIPTQINGRRIASTAFPMGIFSGNKRVTARANATTMTPRPAFTIREQRLRRCNLASIRDASVEGSSAFTGVLR
jgi:hypothetical protein